MKASVKLVYSLSYFVLLPPYYITKYLRSGRIGNIIFRNGTIIAVATTPEMKIC